MPGTVYILQGREGACEEGNSKVKNSLFLNAERNLPFTADPRFKTSNRVSQRLRPAPESLSELLAEQVLEPHASTFLTWYAVFSGIPSAYLTSVYFIKGKSLKQSLKEIVI